ncbi:hypothetical protein AB0D58_31810 [Streptomyces sp. NPDC048210]|uniref:hypothetical protein n=1 Tax=unclassified Streptomyces TaxID=2593676 RepID=UPI002E797A65|nr:hypothetical protein [Streptomyces sp. JV181]MEE1774988.1 hypothetical protein [Streptomyces sp. JV181]
MLRANQSTDDIARELLGNLVHQNKLAGLADEVRILQQATLHTQEDRDDLAQPTHDLHDTHKTAHLDGEVPGEVPHDAGEHFLHSLTIG